MTSGSANLDATAGLARVLRGAAGAILVALALLRGAGPASADDGAVGDAGFDYRIDVAPDLSRLDVRLRFFGFLPRRLGLAGGGGLGAVTVGSAGGASLVPDPDDATALRVVSLDAEGGCAYSVDLGAVARAGGGDCVRAGDDVLTRPGAWLLRPMLLPLSLRVTATIRVPKGLRCAVPWTPEPAAPGAASDPLVARYRLDRSIWSMAGHAVFGRFARESLEAAGATFDVVTLSAPHRATTAGIRRWLRAAIDAIALLYGRFPVPRVGLYVVPVPADADADPVPFGSTWYGGGPHVVLYLSQRAQDGDLTGEWVALHELLHTTMPSIAVEDAWLSEGFVTYYQEVLRARAGFQTPAVSMQLIEEGFGRGRATGTGRTLADESRVMRENHTFYRVYWGGAAIAMKLDVELRRSSGGKRSLDDVMRHLSRRAGNGEDVSAAALVADADAFLGAPTFASIAGPLLASSAFPAVDGCYAWLGLAVRDGRVVTLPSAPGAAERDRIFAPAAPTRSFELAPTR